MKVLTEMAGSGSIGKRYGSVDPDPLQNVMVPEHCFQAFMDWMNFDLAARRPEAARLLACVRLPLLSPQYIADQNFMYPQHLLVVINLQLHIRKQTTRMVSRNYQI
jgi:hypothetical protein